MKTYDELVETFRNCRTVDLYKALLATRALVPIAHSDVTDEQWSKAFDYAAGRAAESTEDFEAWKGVASELARVSSLKAA